MKKNFMFLALASLGIGLASCNGGFKKMDGGILYEMHTSKGNPAIKPGDFISLNMVVKTDGDSVLFSTYDAGQPKQLPAQKPQNKFDVFNGLETMGEGDSATFKIPADSIFKAPAKRPPGFKGNYLVFDIKVEKVIQKGTLDEKVFEGRVNDYMQKQFLALKDAEQGKIKKFVAHEKITPTLTADSLEYQITQQGSGPVPAPGDTVVVNYTGRFLNNGSIFDTSVKDSAEKAKKFTPGRPYKPIHVVAGQHQVIQGWDEGLLLLSKGSKAKLIIPSKLAYGQQGMQIIGPYTPIAFDLEVIDIIHPNPNAPKPVAPAFPPQQGQPQGQPQQQAPVQK